jgi:starch synthase (maltosyl-transferring)
MTPPLIYNLFPRLVGSTTRWAEHARRARAMEFNWLYLNPWHYPGFSGSLYAPKELYRVNPLFLPTGADPNDLTPIATAVEQIKESGLRPMMDLVINHTSKDAPLTQERPEWYVRDERGEVVSPSVREAHDPSKVTVWGDLAEIDNAGSPDREGLWSYWEELVRRSLDLGFQGFRCDAAYMVPTELWSRLIRTARSIDPEVEFFAETLGAPMEDVRELKEAGFHYFFNSSKWWDFRERWALTQHEEFRHFAPSIAFPETHDTARLAQESGGSEAVQRQRYAFAAAFSAGLMMPIGYEFGFRKQVNVVHTQPSDWERKSFDLTRFITRVNRLKLQTPVLQGEGVLRAPFGLEDDVLVLERFSERAGTSPCWILVNKLIDTGAHVDLDRAPLDQLLGYRIFRVTNPLAPEEGEDVPPSIDLRPAEVAYILPH